VPEDLPDPEDDAPLADLDARLRERLRRASGSTGGLTHAELIELADALDRQRRQVAAALADLRRRELEATQIREALEQTSREATKALDERDARLSALAAELAGERERLDARAQDLDAAERALTQRRAEPVEPAPRGGSPSGVEGVFADLRERLERVEVLLELRDRLERVEAAIVDRIRTVREQAPLQIEERLSRLEELVAELARVVRRPGTETPTPESVDVPRDDPRLDAVLDAGSGPLPESADPAVGHVIFLATSSGYQLFECEGAAPRIGEQIELDGLPAMVEARRSSPLPADPRPCLAAFSIRPPESQRELETRKPGSR
jgi:NTP pyrophosphatase (non-canonical NTP hydrolase)